jgi:dissimilatory sulfite reductase (desulfoviridin) alpha/beta subunit
MIEHRVPIVLQKCNRCLYVYFNSRDVVGLEEDKLKEISDVMEKYGIGCVKVPEKDTQLLASRGEFQCIFAHCGTFNYQHDCFLIV